MSTGCFYLKILNNNLISWTCFISPQEPDEIHPQALRELADEVTKTLSITLEKLWQSGEVPDDWNRGNITHVFKKGKRKEKLWSD